MTNEILKFNLQKDIHTMTKYVLNRSVKLSHRENDFSKADKKRLAKLLDAPSCYSFDDECDTGTWSYYILELCRKLKIVSYMTEGVYAGYSSYEESFPDNYIKYKPENVYEKLLPTDKERLIFDVLIDRETEYYTQGMIASYGPGMFSTSGSLSNVANKVNFKSVRKKLLKIIAAFAGRNEVLLKDFITFLKDNHRDLILNKNLVEKARCKHRYAYFYRSRYGNDDEIKESDNDAFDKVEGMFVAWFLEGLISEMQFVDIKYNCEYKTEEYLWEPDYIKSFRLTDKFFRLTDNHDTTLNAVKTTLTPDFKIFVEAQLYPSKVLDKLFPYVKTISEDKNVITLALDKKNTVTNMVENHDLLSPEKVLEELCINIPNNVKIELKSWGTSSDKFIVYNNVGLVEISKFPENERQAINNIISDYLVVGVNDKFRVIRNPNKIYEQFESAEYVPSQQRHKNGSLAFKIDRKKIIKAQLKKSVLIKEKRFIALEIEEDKIRKEVFEFFSKKEIAPLFNDKSGVVIFPESARAVYRSLINNLKKKYNVELV